MSPKWPELSLGELYEFASGLSKPANAFGSGFPFLSFKDVFYNTFVPTVLPHLVQATEKDRVSCSIQRGDVFLTRTSETQHDLGMSCVALRDLPNATFNGFTKRLRPKHHDLIVAEYAGYAFRSSHFRRQVSAMSHLSTRASLNNEMLSRLFLPVPPVATQQAIGRILKGFDDKIALNRQMCGTLEEMARTIFRSWFVDFDPVRAKIAAKAEGRDPERAAMAAISGKKDEDLDSLPPATLASLRAAAALFPHEIVDSALGDIPAGWNVEAITDTFNITMGQSPPGDTYNEVGNGVPFYQGRTDFTFRFPARRVYCSAPTRLAREGDTLMSVRAPVGTLNMASEPCAIGRGIGAFRHRSGGTSYTYHLMHALQPAFEAFDDAGTVFGSISKKDIAGIRVIEPSPTLISFFEKHVGRLDGLIRTLEGESVTLAAVRDTLLPKLLSGELPLTLEDEHE